MAYKDYKRIQVRGKKRRSVIEVKPKSSHFLPYIVMALLLVVTVVGYTAYNKHKSSKPLLTKEHSTEQPRDQSSSRWKYIIIHHSDNDWGSLKRYDSYHRKKYKNGGLLYHYVIGNGQGSADGKVETGKRWKEQTSGGHVGKSADKYNQWGIGICLVGNFEKHSPSRKQMKSLLALTKFLMAKFNIPPQNVLTHRDVNSTQCPGKFFPEQWFTNAIGLGNGEGKVTHRKQSNAVAEKAYE